MKRATTILLALLLVLSLAACGGGTTTPTPEPTQAPTVTPEPTPEPLSKEQLLEQAIEVDMSTICEDFANNQLKAKNTYTDTILLLDGRIWEITGEYILLERLHSGGMTHVEVCIPYEDQLELESGQRVIVVGITDPDVREENNQHYLRMSNAYLVQDRFEFTGRVFHFLGYTSFHVHVPPSDKYNATGITFADGVDTSEVEKDSLGATLKLIAKEYPILGSEGYYEYKEAEIFGKG